jgi:hypothetical protein
MGTPSKKQRQDLNSIVSPEDIQFLPSPSTTSTARSSNAGNVAPSQTLTPKKRKKAGTGQIMPSPQSNVPTTLSGNASQVSLKYFI